MAMMHLSRMALQDDGSNVIGGATGKKGGRGSMLILGNIEKYDSTKGMKQQISPKVEKKKEKKSFMARIGASRKKSTKKG